MSSCRIVNSDVESAVTNIAKIGEDYATAGTEFITNLKAALADAEGDSKDAFFEFLEQNVESFVTTDLPEAIKGMSELLESNRANFEEVDRQIANSIRGGN